MKPRSSASPGVERERPHATQARAPPTTQHSRKEALWKKPPVERAKKVNPHMRHRTLPSVEVEAARVDMSSQRCHPWPQRWLRRGHRAPAAAGHNGTPARTPTPCPNAERDNTDEVVCDVVAHDRWVLRGVLCTPCVAGLAYERMVRRVTARVRERPLANTVLG